MSALVLRGRIVFDDQVVDGQFADVEFFDLCAADAEAADGEGSDGDGPDSGCTEHRGPECGGTKCGGPDRGRSGGEAFNLDLAHFLLVQPDFPSFHHFPLQRPYFSHENNTNLPGS